MKNRFSKPKIFPKFSDFSAFLELLKIWKFWKFAFFWSAPVYHLSDFWDPKNRPPRNCAATHHPWSSFWRWIDSARSRVEIQFLRRDTAILKFGLIALQNGRISASFNPFGPGPKGIDSAPQNWPGEVGPRTIPRGSIFGFSKIWKVSHRSRSAKKSKFSDFSILPFLEIFSKSAKKRHIF